MFWVCKYFGHNWSYRGYDKYVCDRCKDVKKV